MASQFGPLVKAVHGVSTYELQLDLVSGGSPDLPPAREDLVDIELRPAGRTRTRSWKPSPTRPRCWSG